VDILMQDTNNWVNKCKVDGVWHRDRPKTTWSEVVEKDCWTRRLHKEDAVDCSEWIKLVKER